MRQRSPIFASTSSNSFSRLWSIASTCTPVNPVKSVMNPGRPHWLHLDWIRNRSLQREAHTHRHRHTTTELAITTTESRVRSQTWSGLWASVWAHHLCNQSRRNPGLWGFLSSTITILSGMSVRLTGHLCIRCTFLLHHVVVQLYLFNRPQPRSVRCRRSLPVMVGVEELRPMIASEILRRRELPEISLLQTDKPVCLQLEIQILWRALTSVFTSLRKSARSLLTDCKRLIRCQTMS